MHFLFPILGAVLPFASFVSGVELDPDNEASIKSAASTYAFGLMSYYKGNASGLPKEDIGVFPKPPYYWWEGGAAWGGMIEYTKFSGDASYVGTLQQALVANYGPENDIILEWKRDQEGNDDQAFWALSIMSALEYDFPDPADAPASYLDVVQNAFNNMVSRWDLTSCNGGFKWQIYPDNPANGYDYKNAISNGAIFALGARLARYTGNQTYSDWAVKIWDWTKAVGLISDKYEVFDGTDDLTNCTELNHNEWSYNIGMYMHGAAVMYNVTNGDANWKKHTSGLLDHAGAFFTPFKNATDIMFEPLCETGETGRMCNVDQYSFKAYLSRFLAKTAIMAPFSKDKVTKWLRASAVAAAKACTGGSDGTTCGHQWYSGKWDGTDGVGQQMNALEVTQALLTLKYGIVPSTGDQINPPPSPSSSSSSVPSASSTAAASSSVSSASSVYETPQPTETSVIDSAPSSITTSFMTSFIIPSATSSSTSTSRLDDDLRGAQPPAVPLLSSAATIYVPRVLSTAAPPGSTYATVPAYPPSNTTGPVIFPGAAANSKVTGLSLSVIVGCVIVSICL